MHEIKPAICKHRFHDKVPKTRDMQAVGTPEQAVGFDNLLPCSNAETRVVVDGKIITSRGPGTSLEFALSLVHQLFGKEKADEVAGPMVVSKGLEY